MDSSDDHDDHDDHDDLNQYFGPGAPLDLTFNFDDFFKKIRDREATSDEQSQFSMRTMALFCRDFSKNENPADVPAWVMKYFSDQFFKVLAGEKWNDAFPLPWNPSDPVRPRAEQQALDIFCEIGNLITDCPDLKITAAIEEVADRRHVSFETARAAWYKFRHHLP